MRLSKCPFLRPGWSQSDLGQWILKVKVNHRCILDPFQPHSHLSCNIHSTSCIWSLIFFSLVYSGGAHQVKITVKCTGIEHPLWWQRNKWLQLHFTGIEHPLWWQKNKWLQLHFTGIEHPLWWQRNKWCSYILLALSILYDDKGTNDCSYILLALSILYDDKGTNDCSYILLALSILYDDKGTNETTPIPQSLQ